MARRLARMAIGAALVLLASGCASARRFAAPGFALPPGRALTIVVMRPDVEVGALAMGGVATANAEWTAAARNSLAVALVESAAARGGRTILLPDQPGEAGRVVADYEHLHRTVAAGIAQFKYGQVALPTKKGRFDWTLGPGAARIGTFAGGGSHALFLVTRDYFASDGRKAVQVAGAIGCIVGLCLLPGGGEHFAYASLVDLRTGDIVWFNVLAGSAGDIRTPTGARATVERLLASLPKP